MQRRIKINVIKDNATRVTIKLLSTNRKMIVPKEHFLQRVEDGLYEVMNEYEVA